MNTLIQRMREKAAQVGTQPHPDDGVDVDEYVPVGEDAILAATEKLLAVNRGVEDPDERDMLPNDRILMPDSILEEYIRMDNGKSRQKLMRIAAARKSLQGIPPFFFDGYGKSLLIGNPLSSPLEEINTMHILEQNRRVTKFGPGGIQDENSVTGAMQAVHPSQFGFLATFEGPECHAADGSVYTLRGWTPWVDVRDDDVFACRVDGRLEWHKADRVIREHYNGPMLVGEHDTIRLCVTPTHRVLYTQNPRPANTRYRVSAASEVYGRIIRVPITHLPYAGREDWITYEVPAVGKWPAMAFDITDWCSLVGWWLSEGNSRYCGSKLNALQITQFASVHPEQHTEIKSLLRRMGLGVTYANTNQKSVIFSEKPVVQWFERWDDGCYDKWIPEDLFDAPVRAREAMLDALLKGDGRYNTKRWCYCTVSPRLAIRVERLAISLGYTAFIREEKDSREHVTTTNYVVAIHRQKHRSLMGNAYKHTKPKYGPYGNNWSIVEYAGLVYCATVPGGLLHVRGKSSTSGHWSGNSSRLGLDTRLAWGVKVGSDRRLYQRMFDRRVGKTRWVCPEDLVGKVVKWPD